MGASGARARLVSARFDEETLPAANDEQLSERQIAIYDLLEDNVFALPGRDDGPYRLILSMHDARLGLEVRLEDGSPACAHLVSLTALRRSLRQYLEVCGNYFSAVREASPERIEALDEHRRQIHNDGAAVLQERLAGKIETDFDTARRLFTLLTALHWRG